ncbi:MAG TPA: S8/S53 family peptidase [Pilimelia sp.]|nr:S8/S53 family peptidase [Pilimelia sp.]
MNLDPPQPDSPFDDVYRASYEPVSAELQETLRYQVEELAERRHHPDRRRRIIERMQEHRARYREAYQREHGVEPPDVMDIGFVPVDEGFDVIYVKGEILTTRACLQNAVVAPNLSARGFRERERSGWDLPEDVVRLVSPERTVDELLDAVRFLRVRGCPASLNYVMPLAQGGDDDPPPPPPDDDTDAVGKGVGRPVPAEGLAPFPEYAANFPQPREEVIVGVIDGGISRWRRSDEWLADVRRTPTNIDPLDLMPQDGVLDAMAGHGGFVAGIVAQVAPYAEIRVYRTAGTDGLSTESDVASAMLRAVRDGARILNVSMGCQPADGAPPLGMSAAVEQIRRQHGTDVVIVAAAGNYGDTLPCYPAALDGVVSVAGLTAHLEPTKWSTRGSWITFSTVGEGLLSTYVSIDYLNPPPPTEPWAFWSGTSFAAPQVAGLIARRCYEQPGLTPQAVVDDLLQTSRPVRNWGRVVPVLPGVP